MEEKVILCVDDEPMILLSLREQITRHFGDSYDCEIAENVQEAWEIIEELHQEGVTVLVIISDWLMPDIKGDEFLIELHKKFPSIIKVMLTGQADEQAIKITRQEANLFTCLFKPWTENQLITTIKNSLNIVHE
jgi:DNA-binding NtrC family response regulator